MKIGLVTTWFERGAAYVSRAYRDLLQREHSVFIYARAGERYAQGDPHWDSPDVTWGQRVADKVDTYIVPRDFYKWLDRTGVEMLIFNEQQSWDIIVRLRRSNRSLLIGSYVDYYTPATVPFFGLYDFLLCNTRRHYSVFEPLGNAWYIPWGTDLELFTPPQRKHPAHEVVFFHSAGMDVHRKGTDLVWKAFRELTGPVKLLIHCQEGFDEKTAALLREDRRVELVYGDVSAPGLYHRGDVYVYPTRLEGIGLTVPEALACGLPVITTGAPPMNEFVHEEINGKLIEVVEQRRRWDDYYWPECIINPDSLRECMQWYADRISGLREYQSQARNYAEEHLNWMKNAGPLLPRLKEVSSRSDEIPPQLINSAARYERTRYPLTLKRVLLALGARRLKSWLTALQSRSVSADD